MYHWSLEFTLLTHGKLFGFFLKLGMSQLMGILKLVIIKVKAETCWVKWEPSSVVLGTKECSGVPLCKGQELLFGMWMNFTTPGKKNTVMVFLRLLCQSRLLPWCVFQLTLDNLDKRVESLFFLKEAIIITCR